MDASIINRIKVFLFLLLGINAVLAAASKDNKTNSLLGVVENDDNWGQDTFAGNENAVGRVRYTISAREKVRITRLLNTQRRIAKPIAISMKQMSWDFELEGAMQEYIDSIDPKTLYEYDARFPMPYPGFSNNVLLFHVMELPQFASFRGDKKCGYFMHDTFASYNHNAVLRIFVFRVNQKDKCYRYDKCDKYSYQNYKTCNKVAVAPPGDPCSGAGRYMGDILNQAQGIYACVVLNTPGPFTPDPKKQDNAFLCTSCFEDIDWVQKNDVPYESGAKRASNCGIYPQYNKSLNGLCTKPISTTKKSGNTLRL